MRGIVLAAGTGGRMGGPKARLVVRGETLVAFHVRALHEAGCAGVVVVVREEDADVVPEGATAAISRAPDPAGSLRIGLEHTPASHEPVVVTPVDVLPARPGTVQALARALERPGVVAATPALRDGRGGHPVVIRRDALWLEPGQSLHDVLVRLGAARVRVEVDDESVATDLDEPADVLAVTGAPPVFLPRVSPAG